MTQQHCTAPLRLADSSACSGGYAARQGNRRSTEPLELMRRLGSRRHITCKEGGGGASRAMHAIRATNASTPAVLWALGLGRGGRSVSIRKAITNTAIIPSTHLGHRRQHRHYHHRRGVSVLPPDGMERQSSSLASFSRFASSRSSTLSGASPRTQLGARSNARIAAMTWSLLAAS